MVKPVSTSGGLANPKNSLRVEQTRDNSGLENDSGLSYSLVFYNGNTNTHEEVFRIADSGFLSENFLFSLKAVYAKLFATISPSDVEGFTPILVENNSYLVRSLEFAGTDGTELVFAMMLMLEWKISATRIIKIDFGVSRAHTKMFHAETFDTSEKIMAALSVRDSVFGFENYVFMRNNTCYPEEAQRIIDNNLIEPFKKYVVARNLGFKMEKGETFGEFYREEMVDDTKDVRADSFFFLPFHEEVFRIKFDSMTIADLLTIEENVPKKVKLPIDVFMGWLDHEIESSRSAFATETFIEANEAWQSVFTNFVKFAIISTDVKSMFNAVLDLANKRRGYRKVAPEFFRSFGAGMATLSDFYDANELMAPSRYWEAKWIDDDACADFVLLKLYEHIGIKKTVDAISRVVKSGESLTTCQWLWVAENYDSVSVTPVSWWIELIGDTNDE